MSIWDRHLTDDQQATLAKLEDDENTARVVGWSDKHHGPIVRNVMYGSRAAITPTGTYRRVA